VIIGGRIFGKALLEAGRQAVKSGQFRRAAWLHTHDSDHSRFADAKHRPAVASSDAVGVHNATSQSLTDRLTREHRMTLDEARMILNVRPQGDIDMIFQVRLFMQFSSLYFLAVVQRLWPVKLLYPYWLDLPTSLYPPVLVGVSRSTRTDNHLTQRFDHLVKANSPRPFTESGPSGRGTNSHTSHYLLSKVVRARERLQAEVQVAEEVSASSPPSAGPPS
jgi:hypothetical protein